MFTEKNKVKKSKFQRNILKHGMYFPWSLSMSLKNQYFRFLSLILQDK